MTKILLYTLFLFTLLSSCVKNNPDPSWLQVNEWTLEANADLSNEEGQLTHNITDAWVYVDDKVVGVFEVPFKIPILKSGNVNIKIYPTVRNNGISATKKIYPFMDAYEINTTLNQNQTLILNPVTRYNSSTAFYIEDFEDAQSSLVNDNNYAPATWYPDNDPLIIQWFNETSFCRVDLDNSIDTSWLASTSFDVTNGAVLPRGQELYLELDYYNTNNVVTGVLAVGSASSIQNWNIQLNQQTDASVKWKHMYIDLREIISNSASDAQFQQIFSAAIDDGEASGTIIIDNLKIVHYQ